MSFEEQIRERAYHIWLAGGQADGQAIEHWVCAEQALRGEAADAEPVVILTKAAAKPRKAAAAKPVAKAKATKTVAAKPVVKAKAAKAPTAKAGAVQPTAH